LAAGKRLSFKVSFLVVFRTLASTMISQDGLSIVVLF